MNTKPTNSKKEHYKKLLFLSGLGFLMLNNHNYFNLYLDPSCLDLLKPPLRVC